MTIPSIDALSARVTDNFNHIREAVNTAEADIQTGIREFQTALAAAQAGIARAARLLADNPNATQAQGAAVLVANQAVANLGQQGNLAAAQGDAAGLTNITGQLRQIAAAAPVPAPPPVAAPTAPAAPPAPVVPPAPVAPTAQQPAVPAQAPSLWGTTPQPPAAPAAPGQPANDQANWFTPAPGQQAPGRNTDLWGQRVEDGINTAIWRTDDLHSRMTAIERFLGRRADGTFAFTGNGGGPNWFFGSIVGLVVWVITWIVVCLVSHADIVMGGLIGGAAGVISGLLVAFITASRDNHN